MRSERVLPAWMITPAVFVFLISLGLIVPLPAGDPQRASLSPSAAHLLGTDPYGHDLLWLALGAALRTGGQAVWATLLTLVISLCIGIGAAVRPGGLFDNVQAFLGRILDALGPFLLAACLATLLPSLSLWGASVFLAFLVWPNLSGIVRAEALSLLSSSHIEAVRATGASPLRIATIHVLPALADRLTPPATAMTGAFIGLFGALGFLGVGVASEVSLGFMIFDGLSFLTATPLYFATSTGAFICLLAAVSAVSSLTRSHLLPRREASRWVPWGNAVVVYDRTSDNNRS